MYLFQYVIQIQLLSYWISDQNLSQNKIKKITQIIRQIWLYAPNYMHLVRFESHIYPNNLSLVISISNFIEELNYT